MAPKKLHLHPLRDVCVQCENNTANAFQNIVRKLDLSSVIEIKVNNRLKIKGKKLGQMS